MSLNACGRELEESRALLGGARVSGGSVLGGDWRAEGGRGCVFMTRSFIPSEFLHVSERCFQCENIEIEIKDIRSETLVLLWPSRGYAWGCSEVLSLNTQSRSVAGKM